MAFGCFTGREVDGIRVHPHAAQRLAERGASPDDGEATVLGGESFPAKHGRTGHRRNFALGGTWRGKA